MSRKSISAGREKYYFHQVGKFVYLAGTFFPCVVDIERLGMVR